MYQAERILKRAKELGFCDAAFVSAEPFHPVPGLLDDPGKKLAEAESILILFADYTPIIRESREKIALSAYYPVSNAAYHQAKQLERELCEQGRQAVLEPSLPLRQAALRFGGEIGRNGMYYHPVYGSSVVIQALITDLQVEFYPAQRTNRCTGCGACVNACPTGAIAGKERELCMRNHMKQTVIPDRYKKEIYQLLGCEKCQLVCPINRKEREEHIEEFDLVDVLKGKETARIQELTGKNMAPKMRILRQAICYAANQYATEAAVVIRELQREKLLAEAAEWALKKLDADEESCYDV